MRGHALHTFLVALTLPLRRRADFGAPLRDERASAPSSPGGPAPVAVERVDEHAAERTSGGGGATATAERAVTEAPPRRRFVPSGGYQVHNGRVRRAVGD